MAMMDAVEVDHLAAERAAAQFDVQGMKVAWAGSRHAVEVADRMARLVASDPVSAPLFIVPFFQTQHGSEHSSCRLPRFNPCCASFDIFWIPTLFLKKKRKLRLLHHRIQSFALNASPHPFSLSYRRSRPFFFFFFNT
jgi:hypothetical protein